MNFKQFLSEIAVSKTPRYVDIEIDEAISILKDHCKNALWMIKENRPIFRGDPNVLFDVSKIKVVDTTKTKRASQNTTNFYTVIFDNHPGRKDFPKRSESFIGTTSRQYASDYGDPFVIIPYDTAKIGFVNSQDMWDTPVKIFGNHLDVRAANDMFRTIFGKSPYSSISIEDFETFDKDLKDCDKFALIRFWLAFGKSRDGKETPEFKCGGEYANNFLNEIWKAYSAESTGHEVFTTKTMPHKSSSEVWVGGNIVIISQDIWDKIVEAFE